MYGLIGAVVIAAGFGALIGPQALAIIGGIAVVGYVVYSFLSSYKEKKYETLNGRYTVEITTLKNHPHLIAEVEYRGFGDGSFDIEKIYRLGNPEVDVWDEIDDVEGVRHVIREYFWNLRGHGPVAR